MSIDLHTDLDHELGAEEQAWVNALDYPWPTSDAFIPHEPSVQQDAFLWYQGLEALYGGAAGGGKMLALDTPIPTPDGWTTMGELKRGDELFDEHGNTVQVVQAHNVNLNPASYRLMFDDGSHIDACADHRWLTYNAKELTQLSRRTPEFRAKRRAQRASRATGGRGSVVTRTITVRNRLQTPPCLDAPRGAIRTTKQIYDTLFTASGRVNHAIRVAGSIALEDVDLPMDPYILGLWLGDGATNNYIFTSADPELVQAFVDAGYRVRPTKRKYTHCVLGIRQELRKAGVFGNKHVPAVYLRASREQRLALLQGLMDSDGTCNKNGSVSFGNTNRQLAESVAELARSFGSKCAIRTREAKLNGKNCGTTYIVKWSPDYPAFRLQRKLDRQKLERRRTTKFHYIVGCEKIDSVPMRCITVSNPSGLFLAGKSMMPTHNSDALLMAALQYVDVPSYSALLLRRTYTELMLEEALLDRANKWLAHTSAAWSGDTMRWTFPSGARLQFGYLATMKDRARYQSAEYQYIGFDELTSWEESDYRFMFSRLRRKEEVSVPLRMRAATNPGGRGHKWVNDRFIKPYQAVLLNEAEPNPDRIFIPAKLSDNTHVDQESYRQSLAQLEPELVEQLLEGNWDAREPGNWMMRDQRWIDAVEALGQLLWDRHLSGEARLPAPMVAREENENQWVTTLGLNNGIDWGEHTQGYIIWRLPDGGVFVPPSEVVKVGEDPARTTHALLEAAMKFEYPLVQSNYDAAGVQSMRTYVSIARRLPRYANTLRSMKIPFGNYKRESIGYLRLLARRTFEGHKTRILAIHPDNVELLRQLRAWERKNAETDDAVKTDDHGPDALIAGIAPIARENRHYIESEFLDSYNQEDAYVLTDLAAHAGAPYARH